MLCASATGERGFIRIPHIEPARLIHLGEGLSYPITVLTLQQIRIDGGTQLRAKLSHKVIEEYAAAMKQGHAPEFPPVIVFYDGTDHWLTDGHHRYHAAEEAGLDTFQCEVRQGTRRDAVVYSVGANATHGLRRTNADKRKVVEMLLEDPEFGDQQHFSDRMLAHMAAVSQPFVSKLRALRDRGGDNGYHVADDDADHDAETTTAAPAPTSPPMEEPPSQGNHESSLQHGGDAAPAKPSRMVAAAVARLVEAADNARSRVYACKRMRPTAAQQVRADLLRVRELIDQLVDALRDKVLSDNASREGTPAGGVIGGPAAPGS